MRESPALKLIELLRTAGAEVAYHDPHVPELPELDLVLRAARARRARLRRDRHRALRRSTTSALVRATRRSSSTSATRPGEAGAGERQGLEAVKRGRPCAGLGDWGPNLVRNFDELAELAWLCDLDDGPRAPSSPSATPAHALTDELRGAARRRRARRGRRSRRRCRRTTRSRAQALAAGKHVFVEKPPAMRAAEMEELVALAEERDLVLMPGHLLLYHPGVRKLKELVDAGELGDVLCVYGNRQNLGVIRTQRERALVARRPRPLGDPLPRRRGAERGRGRTGTRSSTRASRTSSSATCASRPGRSRTCTSPGSTRTRCAR